MFGIRIGKTRPRTYGKCWDDRGGDIDWYTWMYNGRLKMHTDMVEWVKAHEPIESIVDIGCGLGVGYCDTFADKHYIGIDLSINNVKWCNGNRKNLGHRYVCIDFMKSGLVTRHDLVFSSGTIDNSYGIDGFLKAMVQMSRKWIYLTCYRGWFLDLKRHKYRWNKEHGCFYNDVSPHQVRKLLNSLGCRDVVVEPIETGNKETPYETRIIARVKEQICVPESPLS